MRIPEAMAFAAEIILNRNRQVNRKESLRGELRHLTLGRWSTGSLVRQLLDAATIMMLLPRLVQYATPMPSRNILLIPPLRRSAVLRMIEGTPGMTNWVLYVACCAVAGVPRRRAGKSIC